MNEQQKAVADFLATEKVEFSAKYIGESIRDDWQCDAWRVSYAVVKNPAKLPGTATISTDYYTGLGHRKAGKPVVPCAADVLYSLILDSSAANMSFNDWCSDYGYDNDSLKAFNTYQACCKTAKDLRQVFTNAQIETLRDLQEDY